MRILPLDTQWGALARSFPDEALACWSGNAADGPEPLVGLAKAIAARDWPRVEAISARLADFRNREALLDPNKQSVPMLQAIETLRTKLVGTQLEISQLQSTSPNSPLLASTRQRAVALQGQIDDARTKITGAGNSLVPKIREYDMLTLEREFSDKQLASATTSLEAARITANRQQLYLESIVQPNAAD